MNPNRDNEKKYELTIGDIIDKMGSPSYPDFIPQLVQDVQDWMNQSLSDASSNGDNDLFYSFSDDAVYADIEKLVKHLEWAEDHADLIPGSRQPLGFEDAVVLSMGPSEFEDGIRVAVDHSAIFARGTCKRLWVLCDSWMISEVIRYTEHLRALSLQGVAFHFILVTPWGWTEIPVRHGSRAVSEQIDWKKNRKSGHSGTSNGKKEEDGFQ